MYCKKILFLKINLINLIFFNWNFEIYHAKIFILSKIMKIPRWCSENKFVAYYNNNIKAHFT